MSDQPSWRPSDEEIATVINEYMKRLARKYMKRLAPPGGVVDDLQDNPVVALIDRTVEKALAEPRPEAPLNQRLYDLVRYQRHALHDSGLLTDEEFASLVLSGASSARRLEDYDKVRRRLAEQEARHRREVLEAKIEAVRAAAKYSRDAASLEPDDDVGEAHTRTAERLDRMAASYAELAALDKEAK